MPTIVCYRKDLEKFLGRNMEIEEWSELLEKVKSELKEYNKDTDEMKIENIDTNRPDLWSSEGITRQLRQCVFQEKISYPFFNSLPGDKNKIFVDINLKNIRPYIGGFLVKNIQIDEFFLKQIIQTQEKLCDNFGRFRELIAIGVYDSSKIEFPLYYKGFGHNEKRFCPLGFTEELTPEEILKKHPKGQEYAKLVSSYSLYPLIIDSKEKVLSFPPVINSDDLGKVTVGNTDLFVEVTGTDLEAVILTTNILACNLSDRGAEINPFSIEYSYDINISEIVNKELKSLNIVITPQDFNQVISLEQDYLEKIIGEKVEFSSIKDCLSLMGFDVITQGDKILCQSPPYRRDCLHQADLVEDFAIGRGYNTFIPQPLDEYTIGGNSKIVEFGELSRNLMIGMGFQEFMTYILSSREKVCNKMNSPERKIIEVDNVMSDNFSVLRPSLIPLLLEIESKNLRIEFPHKIFEEGEVVLYSPEENFGCKTMVNLTALVSHSEANFSEIHSYLHSLMFYLNIDYTLEEIDDLKFISGRAGKILCNGREAGLIGEIHPQILENWGIVMPCSVFELTLDYII